MARDDCQVQTVNQITAMGGSSAAWMAKLDGNTKVMRCDYSGGMVGLHIVEYYQLLSSHYIDGICRYSLERREEGAQHVDKGSVFALTAPGICRETPSRYVGAYDVSDAGMSSAYAFFDTVILSNSENFFGHLSPDLRAAMDGSKRGNALRAYLQQEFFSDNLLVRPILDEISRGRHRPEEIDILLRSPQGRFDGISIDIVERAGRYEIVDIGFVSD